MGSRLAWVVHLVDEPGYPRHGLGYPLCECGDLPLEVYQEGIRPPPPNDFDGAVGEPISCAWNPRRWNPILRAVARKWMTMLDPVTDFCAAPGAK